MKQTMKKMIACTIIVAILLNFVEPTKSILQNHTQAADYTTLAENLKIDGTWTEMKYFEELDDYDDEPPRFYKIVIPSDGKIDLKVKMYMYGHARLYTEDLTQDLTEMYCYGNELTPDIDEEQLVLSAGTYYLKISNYNAGAYQIYVQFESFSVNDTGADSYISPFTYSLNTTITGAITPTDEEDWYKLILPKGKYPAKFIAYFSRMEYVLYNSDLREEIGSGSIYGQHLTPETKQLTCNLSGGTYYLKICGGDECYGKYQFLLSGQGSVAATSVPGSSAAPTSSAKPKTSAKPKASATPRPSATASVDNTYDDDDDYLPLKQVHLGRVVRHKKKIKIYFSQDINADYYVIRYARNRNFNGKTKLKVVSWRKNSCVIKKLKRHRKYYIQVCSARRGNDLYFGKWSNKKAVRTK